ncbi:hypothetical protein KKG46_02680 [Patescibacteria group bacterium]|nr:hypothetical protein [Patescibacteria group bacterium]
MQEDTQPVSVSIVGQWSKLQKNKKAALIAFTIGAIFVIFFTFSRIQEAIYSPFLTNIDEIKQNRELLKDPIAEQEAIDKRTDTDGDSLSDWSEENIYKTSPYLWSTAGDDVPDNVKIAMGINPLCKAGDDCTAQSLNYDLPTTTLPFVDLQGTDVSGEINNYVMNSPSMQEYRAEAGDQAVDYSGVNNIPRDPVVLRKALLDSGKVTQEDLDKISDEQLLQLFDDSVKEIQDNQDTETQAIPSQ